MTIGFLFWLLMILWLIFGLVVDYPLGPKPFGRTILLWILLFLIGWNVFGFPIKG